MRLWLNKIENSHVMISSSPYQYISKPVF